MRIEGFSFGRITVDGVVYRADLLLLPDRVVEDWWRREGHTLHPEDLEEVLAARPDCLVVGTGALGVMQVPEPSRAEIRARGMALVVHPTPRAVRAFNRLQARSRVAGAFHLTC